MRVVIVSETFLPKVDGIVKVACLLLDHLAKRGHQALVVAPRYGDLTHVNGAPVHSLPSLSLPLYPEARLGFANLDLFRRLSDFQPDVAHLFHPVLAGIPALAMLKWLDTPTLTSFHLDYARLARQFRVGPFNLRHTRPLVDWLTRTVFNSSDYSLAPSRRVQRQMQELGVKRVGWWRRGVDADQFHPRFRSRDMRREMAGAHADATLLLYVGRLSHEKQLHHIRPALEAMPDTRLVLVGDGPARESLERQFAGLPVNFMGYLRGERLSKAYASADIFVFPSRLETFGLVVTEAMAAGLPVVASRVGGVADVVREGDTGYTFAVGDTAGLIDGVRSIKCDRANIRRMGALAREYAETQSWDAAMDELLEVYAEVISRRASRHGSDIA